MKGDLLCPSVGGTAGESLEVYLTLRRGSLRQLAKPLIKIEGEAYLTSAQRRASTTKLTLSTAVTWLMDGRQSLLCRPPSWRSTTSTSYELLGGESDFGVAATGRQRRKIGRRI